MKYIYLTIIGLLFSVNIYSQLIATMHSGGASSTYLIDSLFAYYLFQEAAGDAIDSHNSYDLTVNGPTREQAGKINYCYSYITNDYVGYEDNDDFDFAGTFSISLWIKTPGSGAWNGIVTNHGTAVYGWELVTDDAAPSAARWRLRYDGGDVSITSSTVITDDIWHHLVVSNSAVDDTMKIWVDGDLEDSDENTNGVWYAAGCRMTIGSRLLGAYYEGEIDEVAFFRGIELTHIQVDSLHNSGNALAYPFN